MSWHNRATFVDIMMMDHVVKQYPQHTVAVINRAGRSVCGSVPPNPVGKVFVMERAEHDWQVID